MVEDSKQESKRGFRGPALRGPSESDVKTTGSKWARAFDGWQAGATLVACALITAAVVVPRPVVNMDIPLPRVDWQQFALEAERDEVRAKRARSGELPYEVRAVGEGLRQLGRAEAAGSASLLDTARRDLESCIRAWATKPDPEALLALRALQAEYFVRAVRAWEKDPSLGTDLQDLGGNFVDAARKNSWLDEDGKFVSDDRMLRLLFRFRFSKVLRLDKHPFSPSLNDLRMYHRFRLEQWSRKRDFSESALAEQARAVAALAETDSHYPGQIALGVISFRLGRYAEAVELFAAFRHAHPTGPWSLRVQNYLAAAVLESQ